MAVSQATIGCSMSRYACSVTDSIHPSIHRDQPRPRRATSQPGVSDPALRSAQQGLCGLRKTLDADCPFPCKTLPAKSEGGQENLHRVAPCLLYTSDAADE